MCKVCNRPSESWLCALCVVVWEQSPEKKRYDAFNKVGRKGSAGTAQADFVDIRRKMIEGKRSAIGNGTETN